MSKENQSLEEILFDLAVQKPTAEERAAFLDHACRGNPGLRAQVEELLEGHFGGAGFLEAAASGPESAATKFERRSDPTQPNDSPVITGISRAVNRSGWSIAWRSRPGHSYALEYRPALDGREPWSRLGVFRATDGESSWHDPETNATRRFYRVVELELAPAN